MNFRIGQGIDAHRFGDGDYIVIGGVEIPHDKGLIAHSDGDVLLHAICDAILGALGRGDIGRHFPDTDARFKNADSRDLLRKVWQFAKDGNFQLVNLDATIVAQAPKMMQYVEAMQQNIAEDLHCWVEQINIKATTTEKMGFTGRGEGIAAFAVVMVQTA